MQEEIFIYETIEINKEILNIRTHIMSKGQVTFCKYIYWKWSKESESHLIKSSRNKEEKAPVPFSSQSKKQKEENKREVCNSRISQRDPMIQTSVNPYMIKNNYLNDLNVQDHFLRPQDSNF